MNEIRNKAEFLSKVMVEYTHYYVNIESCRREILATEIALDFIDKYVPNFYEEYGARSVHDAKPNGLAQHTFKVLEQLLLVYNSSSYEHIRHNIDMTALIIGCIIHDIGKTKEYDKGMNSNIHWVSHPMLGIEMITEGKQFLLKFMEEDTYYRIMSIVGQHHGEFGERPQTVEAYLVHLADYQETKLQILDEVLEECVVQEYVEGTLIDQVKSKYIPFRLNRLGGYNVPIEWKTKNWEEEGSEG